VSGARGPGAGTGEEPAGWQKQKSAATRTLILEATLRCLVEAGYAGTTTHAIAAKAGLSRGALLHHFPTKNAVILATVAHLREARLAALQRALGRAGRGDADALRRALEAARAAAREPAAVAARELALAARTDPALAAAVAPAEAAQAREWRETVRAAIGAPAAAASEGVLELARVALEGLAAGTAGGTSGELAEGAWHALETLVRGAAR